MADSKTGICKGQVGGSPCQEYNERKGKDQATNVRSSGGGSWRSAKLWYQQLDQLTVTKHHGRWQELDCEKSCKAKLIKVDTNSFSCAENQVAVEVIETGQLGDMCEPISFQGKGWGSKHGEADRKPKSNSQSVSSYKVLYSIYIYKIL